MSVEAKIGQEPEQRFINPDSFHRQVGRVTLDVFAEKAASFFKADPYSYTQRLGLYRISSYFYYQKHLLTEPIAKEVGLKPTSKVEEWEAQKFSVLVAEIVVPTGTIIIVPLIDRIQAIAELKFEIYFEVRDRHPSKIRTVNFGRVPDNGDVAKIVADWDETMNENIDGLREILN